MCYQCGIKFVQEYMNMSYYSFQYSCVLTRFLVYKTASSEVFCFWSRTFQNQYAFKLNQGIECRLLSKIINFTGN